MIFDLKNSSIYSGLLEKRLNAVSEAVADDFLKNAQDLSPVKTGHLKASWQKEQNTEGFSVANYAEYAGFVNDGTSKQVGQHFFERAKTLTEEKLGRIIKENINETK